MYGSGLKRYTYTDHILTQKRMGATRQRLREDA